MTYYKKIFFLIFIIISINKAWAGWVISEVSSDNFGNKQFQTTFIQNNMIRFETESSVAIINLTTKKITLVFGMYRLYWIGSIEEFKKGTLSVFEQKLENIVLTADPEQREIARELIAELKKGQEPKINDTIKNINIKINNTNINETIAGYKSTKYEIYILDSLVEKIWVTDSINPYKDIEIENMISFTNQLKPDKLANTIDGSDAYLNLINNGLAMKSEEKNPLGGFQTTTVVNVTKVNINIDIFSPPANYRKAELNEIMLIRDNDSDYLKLQQEFQKAKDNSLYD